MNSRAYDKTRHVSRIVIFDLNRQKSKKKRHRRFPESWTLFRFFKVTLFL